MIRAIAIGLAVFLIPFALYAIALVIARKNPFTGSSWKALDAAILALIGIILAWGVVFLGMNYSGERISGRNPAAEVEQRR